MMRNYLSIARVLDELILDLRGKGADIPGHVADSLKAGRSLAIVGLNNPDDAGVALKTQSALENVEMNLLSIAEAAFGREYADGWQRKIVAAGEEEAEPVAKKQTFVAGVPKGAHWVRIETKDLFEVENVQQRLDGQNLTARKQDDGFTLVYGRKEDVTGFLSEIREEIRRKIGKGGM